MKNVIKGIFGCIRGTLFYLYSLTQSLRGMPAMTPGEMRIMKILFKSFKKKKIRVLEWGCGRSTIYFVKYIKSLGIDCEWYGIENSKEWYEQIKNKISKNNIVDQVHLFLFQFTPFWLKQGWSWESPDPKKFAPQDKHEVDYISFPGTLGIQFDVIIVDARFRRRCLIEAQKMLDPKGVAVLHDAQKERYHSSLQLYKYGKFYDSGYLYADSERSRNKIWIGSNNEFVDEIKEMH